MREKPFELRIASDTQPEVTTYWATWDQRAAMALDFLASGYTVEYGNRAQLETDRQQWVDAQTRVNQALREGIRQ